MQKRSPHTPHRAHAGWRIEGRARFLTCTAWGCDVDYLELPKQTDILRALAAPALLHTLQGTLHCLQVPGPLLLNVHAA